VQPGQLRPEPQAGLVVQRPGQLQELLPQGGQALLGLARLDGGRGRELLQRRLGLGGVLRGGRLDVREVGVVLAVGALARHPGLFAAAGRVLRAVRLLVVLALVGVEVELVAADPGGQRLAVAVQDVLDPVFQRAERGLGQAGGQEVSVAGRLQPGDDGRVGGEQLADAVAAQGRPEALAAGHEQVRQPQVAPAGEHVGQHQRGRLPAGVLTGADAQDHSGFVGRVGRGHGERQPVQ
jgi:hypothetical protein